MRSFGLLPGRRGRKLRFRSVNPNRRWADQTAKEGKFAEAEAAYRKSLDAAVASKTLKKDFTGKVLESLAILYDSQGRKADADKARRDAKAIMRSRLALGSAAPSPISACSSKGARTGSSGISMQRSPTL